MPTIELTRSTPDLSELMERVGAGENFIITREGVPVARLTPTNAAAHTEDRRADVGRVVERMKAFRKNRPAVSYREIREMIEEGRA